MLYIIRVIKYLVYFCVICMLLLALVFYTSDHGELTFWEMIPFENYRRMALFLVVFAAVYPLIGFIRRKVYLNRSFAKDRDALIEPILYGNYQIQSEQDQKIVFRHKNPFIRFIRLYEDKITIDFSNNPIVIDGLRRDVYRFARSMEYVVRAT